MHNQLPQSLLKRGWLPCVLSFLIVMPPAAHSQQTPAPPQLQPVARPVTIQSFRVIALAGDGEMNDMGRGIMAPLVVQVLDQNGRPVEGANVTFRFPLNGASATFSNGQNSVSARSNADGQAAALGWRANGKEGAYEVRVTATRENEMGAATVKMTNVAKAVSEVKTKPKKWWSSKWVKIGAAAGVATAVVLLTRGNSSSPSITISPGSPTIGGPR